MCENLQDSFQPLAVKAKEVYYSMQLKKLIENKLILKSYCYLDQQAGIITCLFGVQVKCLCLENIEGQREQVCPFIVSVCLLTDLLYRKNPCCFISSGVYVTLN